MFENEPQSVRNLKKLALLYTKSSRDVVEDYELDNLIHLHKLETLKIEMDSTYGKHLRMSCAFPPTLKKLRLCGVQLPWNYMKIVASLPYLQILELRNHACTGYTGETSEGGFSWLVFLQIDGSNVRRWITEASHFPRLECLVFRCCWRLLEVPNEIGRIPTLESMELDEQNKSLMNSAKWIQKDRPSFGYDPLHIRAV